MNLNNIKEKKLLILIISYLIITILLSFNYYHLYINTINPLFFLIIIFYSIYELKKSYIRFKDSNNYNFKMFIIVIIYLVFLFNLGFIIGYARSPYSHTIRGIIKNIYQLVIPIIGIELIRGILIVKNRNNKGLIFLITLILILLEVNYWALFSNINNPERFFQYFCSTILPLIFSSSVYSYLCYHTSYKLPLIFRIFEIAFQLLLPIYPNINWFVTGSIGIIVPIIIFFLFKYRYFKIKNNDRKMKSNKFGMAFSIIFAIFLVAFMLGFFKYEMVAILSNSMYPSYERGDIVIYEKINDLELQNIPNNSIIVYTIGNQIIAHRIVDVVEENGTIKYRTKGDYNNAPDSRLVSLEQIKGVYVLHIKYLGFPAVWLNEFFNKEEAVVETK